MYIYYIYIIYTYDYAHIYMYMLYIYICMYVCGYMPHLLKCFSRCDCKYRKALTSLSSRNSNGRDPRVPY